MAPKTERSLDGAATEEVKRERERAKGARREAKERKATGLYLSASD